MDLEQLGESERVLTDLTEARDAFHALGNPGEEGNSEYGLGIALEHLRRREESWRAFERALPLLSGSGDVRFVAFTFNHMGLLRLDEGKPDQARELFQQALQRLEAGGDRRSAVNTRVNIAQARWWRPGGRRRPSSRWRRAAPSSTPSGTGSTRQSASPRWPAPSSSPGGCSMPGATCSRRSSSPRS